MGKPKNAPTAAAAAGAAARPQEDIENDMLVPDQDLQRNLSNLLAAAAEGAKAKAAAAGAGSAPKPAAAGNAQPGLLPLKRISTAAAGGQRTAGGGAAKTGRAAGAGAAGAGAAGSGSKRTADATLPAPGERKKARTAAGSLTSRGAGTSAAGAAEPLVPTDRDGVPSLDGLRSWAAARVAAMQERTTTAFGQQCAKVIEDGYNRLNELAGEHHAAVSRMLQSSSEALEVARSQHNTALEDIGAVRDGLLGELESLKGDLVGALRSEVVGPLEAGLAALQAKCKI